MDYERICEFEAMETEKRFLPYVTGTPSTEKSSNDQYQRLNLVFFTDSHVDMPWCVPEACDNVERTIDFANNFPVPFDAVMYGGDTITFFGHVEKSLAKERSKCLVDRVKNVRLLLSLQEETTTRTTLTICLKTFCGMKIMARFISIIPKKRTASCVS